MENRIKERIKQSGVTLRDVAEKLDITPMAIYQIAAAKMPKIETFVKIATALDVPVWSLILSDEELAEIRVSQPETDRPTDEFKCPVCGANLKVIPAENGE